MPQHMPKSKMYDNKKKKKRRGQILIWIGLIAIIGSVVFATAMALYGYYAG
ncbi:hypothetical protein ACWOFJ_08000 [Aerococcus sanguinicola]|uniref:MerR family transcriptional regulator n=1 Tax=Aerococcus sanguinicola TaxID=119206 RepID=A0A2I1MNR9_9LACT|nr:MerR family transcriptional regulator [Aerococcus sanguinicola]PKZ21790.1 MerR family transcriptional regulator [Aerococcus sanguinicola]